MSHPKALTPEEAITAWKQALPDEVIITFNEALQEKFDGRYARVVEADLYRKLKAKGYEHNRVQEQGWLGQVKDRYVEAGWKVTRRTPGCDDNFATFYFFELK